MRKIKQDKWEDVVVWAEVGHWRGKMLGIRYWEALVDRIIRKTFSEKTVLCPLRVPTFCNFYFFCLSHSEWVLLL